MNKKILISLLIGLFSILNTGLAYAGFMDSADSAGNNFSAATLSFNLTDNSGSSLFVPLFYSSDLILGDSKTGSFRIVKEGLLDFKYNIYFVKTAGDDTLCSGLNIEAKMDGTTLYNGSLSGLSIDPRPTITDRTDEWEITISLFDSEEELMETNCSFSLVVKGWQLDSDGSWGFYDSDFLAGNEFSTTTWEIENMSLGMQSDSSSVDSLDSPESEPSAEMNPDIPEEESETTGTTDSELTPSETPTPTPSPEEPTPTPTPQELEEEDDRVDAPEDSSDENSSETDQIQEETEEADDVQ